MDGLCTRRGEARLTGKLMCLWDKVLLGLLYDKAVCVCVCVCICVGFSDMNGDEE